MNHAKITVSQALHTNLAQNTPQPSTKRTFHSPTCFNIYVTSTLYICLRRLLRHLEYTGRGELASRQQALQTLLQKLRLMADSFGVAVVITNQMSAKVCTLIVCAHCTLNVCAH
jgi:hypothetical protein